MDNMIPGNIDFEQTCYGCPWSGDFLYNGNLIGKLRFRWGHFQCWPVVDEDYLDNIIDISLGDEYLGAIYRGESEVIKYCKETLSKYYNHETLPSEKESSDYLNSCIEDND